jgi:hypothetical protein
MNSTGVAVASTAPFPCANSTIARADGDVGNDSIHQAYRAALQALSA